MASGNPQNTSQELIEPLESQSNQSKKVQPKTVKGGSSKKKKMTDKEQSEQFIKTARELEVDESGEKFDRFLKRASRK